LPGNASKPAGQGLTLRSRVRVVYAVLALVVVAGVILNITTFRGVLHERQRLSDQLDPAAIQVQRWLTSLVDRETGVRGYALTGDPAFLEPRTRGLATSAQAEAQVRSLLRTESDLLPLVDRLHDAGRAWKTRSSDPTVAKVRASGPRATSAADLATDKTAFDQIRARADDLAGALRGERTTSRDRLAARNRELEATSAIAVLLVAAGVTATWFALNRLVLRPLSQLGGDARLVADGQLRHRIEPVGPPELTDLAGDIEAMRERIIAELEQVEQARSRLIAQAEDLERSNQELEQFAYVASHDLQEPLRKVAGFCQLLQRRYADQLDDRADEYIALAVDGAKRMLVLINDLLAFSRVGRTTTSFAPVDLAALVRTAVDGLSEVAAETGATFDIGALPTVTGDATLLGGLVQNLLANAIKFHGQALPHVVLRSEDGPDEWTFSCADNGIGIAPEYAERVFVIFQRLHTRDVYEGTGVARSWSSTADGSGSTPMLTRRERAPPFASPCPTNRPSSTHPSRPIP
jgi:signal transduction histidine kinase